MGTGARPCFWLLPGTLETSHIPLLGDSFTCSCNKYWSVHCMLSSELTRCWIQRLLPSGAQSLSNRQAKNTTGKTKGVNPLFTVLCPSHLTGERSVIFSKLPGTRYTFRILPKFTPDHHYPQIKMETKIKVQLPPQGQTWVKLSLTFKSVVTKDPDALMSILKMFPSPSFLKQQRS